MIYNIYILFYKTYLSMKIVHIILALMILIVSANKTAKEEL